MIRSLSSAVSGLRTHQVKIEVLGNNIANVNTTGFKAQRVEFQNLISQTLKEGASPSEGRGGTNSDQVGLGVRVGAILTQHSPGALTFTGKNTDLAIQGEGFFVVTDGKNQFFTRDGAFDFDREGSLVKPATGLKALGWATENEKIDTTGVPKPIQVSRTLSLPPRGTRAIQLRGNLRSDMTELVIDGVLKPSESPIQVKTKVLNSVNDIIDGVMTFTQVGVTPVWNVTWAVDATDAAKLAAGSSPQVLGSINFDTAGKVVGSALSKLSISFDSSVGATPISSDLIVNQLIVQPGVATSRLGVAPAAADSPPALAAGKGLLHGGRYSMTINFFDSLGNSHAGSLLFTRDLVGQQAAITSGSNLFPWRVSFSYSEPSMRNDPLNPQPLDLGIITYDSSGLLSSTGLNTLNLKFNNGAADAQIAINPGVKGDASGLTAYSTSSTALPDSQDGYSSGTVQGISIDDRGTVSGVFSNGQRRQLALLSLATFNNPAGLVTTGDNSYIKGNNSGEPQIGPASSGSRGTISAGNLELSNVDLAGSFSELIIAQRGFQANSRVITTSDELLQELMQLKR